MSWLNVVALSAYIRGSTFLPNIPPNPIATFNRNRAWDPSGKGAFVCSLEVVSHGAHNLIARCRDRPDAIIDPA